MEQTTGSIFRIDKFAVPSEAYDEFLALVRATHVFLDTLEGCLQNLILELSSGDSDFNLVTLVEWRDFHALSQAKEAAQAHHGASGVDPAEVFSRLGIRADLANYSPTSIEGEPRP